MKISKNFKKLLLDEMNLVIEKIEASETPVEVTYYFSAVYGVIQRIFNFEYHAKLVHLWVIINPLCQVLSQKFQEPTKPYDNSNPAQLERLIDLTKKLRDAFESDSNIDQIIEEFSVLLYSTNGNGTYLFNKGMFKLTDD